MARQKTNSRHVRRGDVVVVTKGKDRGKRGKVKRILDNGRLEVEKVNMIKRHTKPTQQNPQGGIIDQEGSIAMANVSLWCDKCSAPRRSRKVIDESGAKTRVCAKCDGPFPNPGM
jgi:large subunit ribosomal protein L24